MKFTVQEEGSLLALLEGKSPSTSKNTIRSWIKEKRVFVDGRLCKDAKNTVQVGQAIEVRSRKKFLPQGVEILYDDAYLTVIYKPPGMLSVSTDFEQENTAHQILKDYYPTKKVYVVHRLDQDTSGVMLFALQEETKEELKKMFEKHDIDRRYSAIVEGHFREKEGSFESYLYEDDNYYVRPTKDPSRGKRAVTHYEVIGTSKRYSMLNVRLETGRKNQIRVQLSEHNHPIVGDKKYGALTNTARRLCLHAYTLTFKHPITGKSLSIESPLPDRFYQIVNPKKGSNAFQ